MILPRFWINNERKRFEKFQKKCKHMLTLIGPTFFYFHLKHNLKIEAKKLLLEKKCSNW